MNKYSGNKQHRSRQSKSKQLGKIGKNHGFTLLEALIGFLILSTGMMGIASLQAISLKAGKTSVYSSVAMMKVEELLESMRTNATPVALAAYAAAAGSNGTNGTCSAVVCTPAQLAQEDIYWWKINLKTALPNATATTTSVVYTPAAPPSQMATVQVNVNWAERNKDTAVSAAKTYTITADICTNNASSPC
ncbi:hypothetical protein MNBD_GAMMA06-715 [hydrothermal vent metagenome]|uniref:Type IV fimbrial biogenesis protein PilV n=1 Tax=hydrothermal vent metagenome TaxID=652676 RepID=A0A3B0X9I8_9ZZZZ